MKGRIEMVPSFYIGGYLVIHTIVYIFLSKSKT